MIFVIIYLISFPIILYHNYFSMRLIAEKSKIARSPSFFLFYIALAYGSIAGLWYKYNWKIALVCLAVSWTIDKLSFRSFFSQYVNQTAIRLMNSDWFEKDLDTETRMMKAYEYAKTVALQNVAGKTYKNIGFHFDSNNIY